MAKQWFVAASKDGAFNVAVEGLLDRKFPIYLPYKYERRTLGRKVFADQEERYPGYIILAFDLDEDEDGPARLCPGVDYLLPKDGRPVPLRPDWVPTMRAYELRDYLAASAKSKPVARKDIRIRDQVTIDKAGHAAFGKQGEVIEVGKYRAKLLIGMQHCTIELIYLRKADAQEAPAK